MEARTPVLTTTTKALINLNCAELTAWFAAGGLPVEVVSNCGDPSCRDCITIQPAQAA